MTKWLLRKISHGMAQMWTQRRDPARIDTILNKLGELWRAYPDMRFYQLIIAITPRGDFYYTEYYTEDDVFLKRIEDAIEKFGSRVSPQNRALGKRHQGGVDKLCSTKPE